MGRITKSERTFRVDSANCAPKEMKRFCVFNPFHFEQRFLIPVPGQRQRSHSVEAVWQGLKIVEGRTDFRMFESPPTKRPGEALRKQTDYRYEESKFLFEEKVVDIITARFLIYLPTYLYLLEYLVPDSIIAEIRNNLRQGNTVLFYDWDDNFEITNPRSSFSHSAILAAWFGGSIQKTFFEAGQQWLASQPQQGFASTFKLYMDRYRRHLRVQQDN
jgi:hypothetical protein